ncbi:ATP-binding cassette sub-family B member 9 [Toxocara canis]|uniref:ATP-binding cassette sub-family B member 9 n=1 Tax=Toxocara canis TaxID=6265 RepID=A0A0B2UWY5_TOXCA|nr:ATP-binding cassette sub-family B member 9 [Toxocara canis]
MLAGYVNVDRFAAFVASRTMQRWLALGLVCTYLFSDVVFSTLPLPLYDTETGFNIGLILKYLLLLDGYNFTETPTDFIFFALARLFIIVAAISIKVFIDDAVLKKLLVTLITFCLFSWAFTIIKLLAFAENTVILYCAGPWFSVFWNTLATGLLFALWHFVLTSSPSWNYDTLVEHADEEDSLATGDQQGAADVRESAFQHTIRLLKYCKTQSKWFIAGFVFLIIQSTARIFLPYLTGQVIANIVQIRSYEVLMRSVIWMAVLSFITVFFDGLRGGCFDYATALVNRQMRCDLFRSLVKQEIAFFDSTKTGEIISRLTADCQTMSSTVAMNLNTFLRNGLMLVGALVVMFALSWRLTMVTFMIVPIVAFVTKAYGAYCDQLSERMQSTIATSNQIAEEVMSTMRTVRSFACESRESQRFENSLDEVVQISKKKSAFFVGFMWVDAGCDHVIEVAVLCYGGHLVLSGEMTADNLIAFLLYQMQLGENLYYLGTVFAGLMESIGASRKVFEYMLREPTVANTGTERSPVSGQIRFDGVSFAYPSRPNNIVLKYLGTVFAGLMESIGASRKVFEYMLREPTVANTGTERSPVSGQIRFDGVSFAYPSRPNNIVLKDMSFTVFPGETVALVGPSGGGKTSIVALIEHFYNANCGSVFVDSVPIGNYDHEYIHQKIALVAQEPVLYEGSVRYNILYGWNCCDEEAMIKAAKMANVHDFVMETEHGYDTNCGEKGVQMSGGQKQRIAIARALVRDPAVLILDEATSALDAESEHTVQEAIAACCKQRTVIIIAHRLSTVEKADRIIVVNKGRIVQARFSFLFAMCLSRHENLIQQEGIYRTLVQRQLLAHNESEV